MYIYPQHPPPPLNVTVLAILECLKFKNFSCLPTIVADNTFQCSLAPPLQIAVFFFSYLLFYKTHYWMAFKCIYIYIYIYIYTYIYVYIYIYIYNHIYSVTPRHIFLSLN